MRPTVKKSNVVIVLDDDSPTRDTETKKRAQSETPEPRVKKKRRKKRRDVESRRGKAVLEKLEQNEEQEKVDGKDIPTTVDDSKSDKSSVSTFDADEKIVNSDATENKEKELSTEKEEKSQESESTSAQESTNVDSTEDGKQKEDGEHMTSNVNTDRVNEKEKNEADSKQEANNECCLTEITSEADISKSSTAEEEPLEEGVDNMKEAPIVIDQVEKAVVEDSFNAEKENKMEMEAKGNAILEEDKSELDDFQKGKATEIVDHDASDKKIDETKESQPKDVDIEMKGKDETKDNMSTDKLSKSPKTVGEEGDINSDSEYTDVTDSEDATDSYSDSESLKEAEKTSINNNKTSITNDSESSLKPIPVTSSLSTESPTSMRFSNLTVMAPNTAELTAQQLASMYNGPESQKFLFHDKNVNILTCSKNSLGMSSSAVDAAQSLLMMGKLKLTPVFSGPGPMDKTIGLFDYEPTGEKLYRCLLGGCDLCFETEQYANLHEKLHLYKNKKVGASVHNICMTCGTKLFEGIMIVYTMSFQAMKCYLCEYSTSTLRWYGMVQHFLQSHENEFKVESGQFYHSVYILIIDIIFSELPMAFLSDSI